MELDQVDASGRRWRRFCTCGQEYHVNMSVLEPYLQVLSHGGQEGSGPSGPPPGGRASTVGGLGRIVQISDVEQRCDWLIVKI